MRQSFSRPREERILKRSEFLACYENGRKFHSPRFILFALPLAGSHRRRFGIAVSRKIGNAVTRNRIRRVLRECFRLCPLDLAGLRIVAVAKKTAPGLCLEDARAELYPILSHMEKCRQTS